MSVKIEKLRKLFQAEGVPALDDVSLEAPTGKITALLGPSGAGKSTVLRLIAGLEQADGGAILVEGVNFLGVPVQKREVGFVFQSYALFDHLSVSDNIGFALSVRKTPKPQIDAKVKELLALIQLEDIGGRRPSQLSGGQRQRVAFARALAVQPKVLLLDEPFGALDAKVRVELRDWLRKFQRETKLTTVIVTHDQDEAFEVADHVVVMFNGKVVQQGAPTEIYDSPATADVAAFIGGASVLKGHVRSHMARVGELSVEAPSSAKEGAAVHVMVRPHDIRLAREEDHKAGFSLGKITTLRRIGGYVKLTVALPSDETITVEALKSEIEKLGISEGDRVLVDIKNANVFVDDYTI